MSGEGRPVDEPATRFFWPAAVAAVLGLYYWLFFFPPRLVGSGDPDRYYHLGLSRIWSEQGLVRRLPQVEDLGWGRDFPDKEFLFHLLTGAADWLGGIQAVLLVVPIIGTCIILTLYYTMAPHAVRWRAALLVTLIPLSSAAFIFRLTILRPHLLAILFFCVLLFSILRKRPLLGALACAGFALSYHAFYIILIVIVLAWALVWRHEAGSCKALAWAAGGLLAGILFNPYFPSNLVMSWTHLSIALGLNPAPGVALGDELKAISGIGFVSAFGFSLYLLILSGLQRRIRYGDRAIDKNTRFLFALSLVLTILSMKSVRAAEYAVPATVLLAGYFLQGTSKSWWLSSLLVPMTVLQATTAWHYYADIWNKPQTAQVQWYFSAISAIPDQPAGAKVFTCQWDAGAYLLFLRPDLRFIDILDPTFLWRVSPEKFRVRQQLIEGNRVFPERAIVEFFKADYVLCGSPRFNRQMMSDPVHFRAIPWDASMGPLRVFAIVVGSSGAVRETNSRTP